MKKCVWPILLSGIVLTSLSLNAQARTSINLDLNLAVAPPPPTPVNVVMAPPQGYSNCTMTSGAWFNNVWVPPHQECYYPTPDGATSLWISGYWGCIAVGPGGGCGGWRWFGHHWRGREVGYNYSYGRPYRHKHYY